MLFAAQHTRYKSCMGWYTTLPGMTFARIVTRKCALSDADAHQHKTLSIEQWHAANATKEHRPSLDVPATDILDTSFIDFHRELKRYMIDSHGMMTNSEAAHLHDVLVKYVRMVDTSEPCAQHIES